MIRARADQARALAERILAHPGQELALDALGNPGEYGPLLATFAAEEGLLVEESGAVDNDPEGALG